MCRYWCWPHKRYGHHHGGAVLQEEEGAGGDIHGVREWAGHVYHVPGVDEDHAKDWVASRTAGCDRSCLYNLCSW